MGFLYYVWPQGFTGHFKQEVRHDCRDLHIRVIFHFEIHYILATRISKMATYGKIEEFDRVWFMEALYWAFKLLFWSERNHVVRIGRDNTPCNPSQFGRKEDLQISVRAVGSRKAPTGGKSYKELCTFVKSHFNQKPSESVQRHKFNNCFRSNGENISDFVAALRNMAEYCNFWGSLEDMLRDRLVSGINNERIQRRLLSEVDSTFKKGYEIALSLETTSQHMADLQSTPSTLNTTSASVKKISFSQTSRLEGEINISY